MTEEVQSIRLDGIEYHLPFASVLDQTVDDESLVASIRKEGMIYPIVYRKTEEGREIIDGNTRARLIAEGKVELDKVPLERVEIEKEGTEHAYDLAIQLNFQRRQINPGSRRKTIERIHQHKGWRGKPNGHVTELAELLGVSPATISNDIAQIWSDKQDESIREERKRINHLLTGLRFFDKGEVERPDLSDKFEKKELEIGERYLEVLQERLKARRTELTHKLKSEDNATR